MKIWQLLSPKNLTHADRDLPAPQEGYAKVKITRALLSEADVAVYSGATRVKYPVVPGRYAVGQVVEAGENSYFNKGDRVYLADAMENEESESGIDVAGENRDGFYRDFAFVNASEAYTLPPSVSDEAAFLIDAVATAEKIVDETGVGAGQHVLVIGGGLYANILCQILICSIKKILGGFHQNGTVPLIPGIQVDHFSGFFQNFFFSCVNIILEKILLEKILFLLISDLAVFIFVNFTAYLFQCFTENIRIHRF